MEEVLILVDQHDNTIGYAPRNACHAGQGKLHRAIAVLVFDKQKRILLQKRKAHLWDDFWDIAGATHTLHHPTHDETWQDAAQRFLRTEWNILAPAEKVLSFKYFEQFNEFCEHECCSLLVTQYDGSLHINPAYAYDMRWADLPELQADMAKNPAVYTPWAQIAIQQLSAHALWAKLVQGSGF